MAVSETTLPSGAPGSGVNPPVAATRPASQPVSPAVAPVSPVSSPGPKFRFPPGTPEGIEERRVADAERKKAARAVAAKLVEPPPLPGKCDASSDALPPLADGASPDAATPLLAPGFVPWTPDDVKDFTDELVELSEAKRVDDFVTVAREAKLPPKLIAEIEKDARFGINTKAALKRAISGTIAKWLNKSGISAKNKEEAALLFCLITIKLQGLRLRNRLNQLIEDDAARRKAEAPKAVTPPAEGLAAQLRAA